MRRFLATLSLVLVFNLSMIFGTPAKEAQGDRLPITRAWSAFAPVPFQQALTWPPRF